MSIKIRTYTDPRDIGWGDYGNCAQFCSSQVLVNAINRIYKDKDKKIIEGPVSTTHNLINSLYAEWNKKETIIKQLVQVGTYITKLGISDNIRRSLEHNCRNIVDCLRIFCELELDPDELSKDNLREDQKYVVDLYKMAKSDPDSCFNFELIKDKNIIKEKIFSALEKETNTFIDKDKIIIHGVFNFSSALLAAIDDLNTAGFDILLLFNYITDFPAFYKSYSQIYDRFPAESGIEYDRANPVDKANRTTNEESTKLAEAWGNLQNGNFNTEDLESIQCFEFENMTSLAGYISDVFKKAKRKEQDDFEKRSEKASERNSPPPSRRPVLPFMSEMFYSPNDHVNNLLRAYFPEQFEDIHFLDRPIGHFFMAIVNMWDPEESVLKVKRTMHSDLRECLFSGLIEEDYKGQLVNAYNIVYPYTEKETEIERIVSRLEDLSRLKKKHQNSENEDLKRVKYWQIKIEDLDKLISGIKDLIKVANLFFADFRAQNGSFTQFYSRISSYIAERTEDMDTLDNEMREIIRLLLERIEMENYPDTGTFAMLKGTMSYFLNETATAQNAAKWIVHGFEQIDGDVIGVIPKYINSQLRENRINHFCCLSDKDICSSREDLLPWPLDTCFFDNVKLPKEPRYRIFLISKKEMRNFNKYALFYGLLFSKQKVILSYVKNEDGKENELYFMLRMLGIKPKPYSGYTPNSNDPFDLNMGTNPVSPNKNKLSQFDIWKYNICGYRYTLDALLQNGTMFSNSLLLQKYIGSLLIKSVYEDLKDNGSLKSITDEELRKILDEKYQSIKESLDVLSIGGESEILEECFTQMKKIREDSTDKIDKYLSFLLIYPVTYKSLLNNKELRTIVEGTSEDYVTEIDFENTSKLIKQKKSFCNMCANKDICVV